MKGLALDAPLGDGGIQAGYPQCGIARWGSKSLHAD